ncbi:signal transduction histidine kinase [Deinobacterium chartae]|uniref:histidine kinase n=1 Tax=Deinobacterium chartae TaxID=521158 RepID=A0A841I2A1_9DEIO|nr:HAMP domain-containing sensor histidine kinase [Deinobacterium chartae]MBB6099951.1 signal transduction histidine kinase [Deinobacterium chartae]
MAERSRTQAHPAELRRPKRWRNMSLRLRLALIYTSLSVVLVVMFGALTSYLLLGAFERQFVTRLNEQADVIAFNWNNPALALNQNPRVPSGALIQITDAQGRVLVTSSPILEGRPALPLGRVMLDGVSVRAVARAYDLGGGRIWVGLPDDSVSAARSTALGLLSVGAVVSAILTLLVGLVVGRRALAGLESAARSADALEATDTSLIPLPPRRDEVYRLVAAINRLLERIWTQQAFEKKFIGQTAHELGAPLTSLQGYLQRARLHAPSRELEQAIKVASELQFVSQDLMQLARGRSDLTLVWHYISARTLQDRLARLVENLTFSGDWDIFVLCDPDRLVQALRNVAANARRAAGQLGWVNVNLERSEHQLCFIVRDSGPGLPEGAETQIFEAFYSRSNSSGLGLSVASQIMALHGGEIRARNHPDGGAEFTLVLPIQAEEEDEDLEEEAAL